MKKINPRSFLCLTITLFGLVNGSISRAQTQSQKFASDEPARQPIVTTLIIGPPQSEFLRKLLTFVQQDDLENFARIAETFKLQLTQPVDEIDLKSERLAQRYDIKGPFVESGHYGLFQSSDSKERWIGLRLVLVQQLICVPRAQFEQTFGTAAIGQPFHRANWAVGTSDNPEGGYYRASFNKSARYPRYKFDISLNPSGCTSELSISKNVKTPAIDHRK